MEDTGMVGGGDYDDAVNVIDVWLHEHPEPAPWERDDFEFPDDRGFDLDGLSWLDKPEKFSPYTYV